MLEFLLNSLSVAVPLAAFILCLFPVLTGQWSNLESASKLAVLGLVTAIVHTATVGDASSLAQLQIPPMQAQDQATSARWALILLVASGILGGVLLVRRKWDAVGGTGLVLALTMTSMYSLYAGYSAHTLRAKYAQGFDAGKDNSLRSSGGSHAGHHGDHGAQGDHDDHGDHEGNDAHSGHADHEGDHKNRAGSLEQQSGAMDAVSFGHDAHQGHAGHKSQATLGQDKNIAKQAQQKIHEAHHGDEDESATSEKHVEHSHKPAEQPTSEKDNLAKGKSAGSVAKPPSNAPREPEGSKSAEPKQSKKNEHHHHHH